ncbi:hypothetical protein KAS41_03645 [Candidatus Parcubacteria bacterium]|nr:hypothetical protein [Candidatus Parcubacteria bacterium]
MSYIFLKRGLLIFSVFLYLSLFAAAPILAQTSAGDLLERLREKAGYEEAFEEEESVFIAIGKMINVFLSFLGIVFVVLTIYGGFLWMTASGNDDQVGQARKIIIRSAIGLAIILSAYAITWFAMEQLSSAIEV